MGSNDKKATSSECSKHCGIQVLSFDKMSHRRDSLLLLAHQELEKLRIIKSHRVLTVRGKESLEREELISSSPASSPNNLSHLVPAASVCGHKSASAVNCRSEKPLSIRRKSAAVAAFVVKVGEKKVMSLWNLEAAADQLYLAEDVSGTATSWRGRSMRKAF